MEVCFNKCLCSAVGFNRFVPAITVSDFTGIDLFSEYIKYWLWSRSVIDHFRDNFYIFDKFKSENLARLPSKHNLRKSTVLKSDETYRRANSIFPNQAVKMFQQFEHIRNTGVELFLSLGPNFKFQLKRLYLKRIIAKGTITQPGVELLNKRYYDRLNLEEVTS